MLCMLCLAMHLACNKPDCSLWSILSNKRAVCKGCNAALSYANIADDGRKYFIGILDALLLLSAGICFTREACRDGTEGSHSHANLTSKGCQQNEAVSQQPQHAFHIVQAHKVQHCRSPRSNSSPTRSRVYTTGSSEYTAYITI